MLHNSINLSLYLSPLGFCLGFGVVFCLLVCLEFLLCCFFVYLVGLDFWGFFVCVAFTPSLGGVVLLVRVGCVKPRQQENHTCAYRHSFMAAVLKDSQNLHS